jgi:hypothetical protein
MVYLKRTDIDVDVERLTVRRRGYVSKERTDGSLFAGVRRELYRTRRGIHGGYAEV